MSKDFAARHYKKKQRKNIMKSRKRLQNLTEEEKTKWEYGHERYKNLPEDEKRRPAEYRKTTYKIFL